MHEVKHLSRNAHDSYRIMGPAFGSRAIAKEIGIHVYDDSNKQWAIVIYDGRAVGFASVRGTVITDCYVAPEFRREGAFTKILAFILKNSRGSTANCTDASLPAFLKAGFEIVSKTKNFTKVKRHA